MTEQNDIGYYNLPPFQKIIKIFFNFFKDIGVSIANAFKSFASGIKNFFVVFCRRFRDGNAATKISHIIMGFGNFYHKQIVKGAIFLLFEIGFILFMVLCPQVNDTPFGYKAIQNFITLGTEEGDIFTPADDSMLMLLFGVVTFCIIILFFILYLSNLASAYKAECDKRKREKHRAL